MSILLLWGGVAAGLGVVILLAEQMRQRRRRQWRVEGQATLARVRQCLSLVQQHRGLTTGFLSGNTQFKTQIDTVEAQLRQQVGLAQQQAALMANERWLGIVDHWQRLEARLNEREIKDNFQQHNRLVENLLYLVEDILDQYGTGCWSAQEAVFWKQALHMAEYLGQARAIGTGVAAAGCCDSVSRIRLKYLHEKMGQPLALDAQALGKISVLQNAIRDLTAHAPLQVAFSSEAFYALATEAISGIYQQLDRMNGAAPA